MVTSAGRAEEIVRLRLKWRHQFQFAGYYAAQAKGYYAEEGLDVRILEGRAERSAVAAVLAGEAEFGVSDADIVLARLQGKPLVACASIFQHSPYIVLSRRDRGIRRPSDLVGTTVMLADDQGSAQLHAMLVREGISPAMVNLVPHSWKLDDLIEGRVDAISAYATAEPAMMRARGVEVAQLRPIDYGVDFYGDTLFTTTAEAETHPARTDAFVRASLKGWDHALRHPEEMVELILKIEGVKERGVTRESLLAEAAALRPFIMPELVEIGHINAGRWRRIAATFTEFGMARADDAALEGFVREPHRQAGLSLRRALLLGGGVLALSSLVVLWNVQMGRRVRRRTRELREEVRCRREIERELRGSEARFRTMFAGAATGIATTTPERCFLQANPAYCATLGYTEEELRGQDALTFIHPDDREAFGARFRQLIEGGADNFVIETRCLQKQGGFVWKRASVSVVRAAEGRPASIIAVTEDITERVETAEKLRQSEERFRYVARATADAIWDWDVRSGVLWWSEGMAKLFGHAAGELAGGLESWTSRIHPGDRGRVTAGFHAFIAGSGETWHADYRFLRRDGSHAFVLDRAFAIRDGEGRALRAVGGITDLTERRLAENAAHANAELLRMAGRVAGIGAWALELPGGRLTWSEEVFRIHEVDSSYRPEVSAALDFYTPESRRLLEAALERGDAYDLELEFVTAKGRRLWVRTTSAKEREEGGIKRLYGVIQDVTERRFAAERLKASEAQYRLLFNNNPHPMWVYEAESLRFLAVNAAAVAHYGYSEAEFLGMTIRDIRPSGQMAALNRMVAGLGQAEKHFGHWLHRKRDGTEIEVEISSDGIVFDGRPARLTLAHDVTSRRKDERELARVNRSQRLLGAGNEALVRAESETGLLGEICRIAVEIGGYRMAWVGYAEQTENRLIRRQAHAGAEEGYFDEVQITWADGPVSGRGPDGRTIRGGVATVCADIEADGDFLVWREAAQRRGYRGVICLPLREGARTHGLLGLYSAEVIHPGADEIGLLQHLADNLAYGITALRQRIERQKTQEAVLAVARGVSAAAGADFFDRLTLSMVEALGADVGVVGMIGSDAPGKVRTISLVVDGSTRPNLEYPLTGAPCESITPGETTFFFRDLQAHFPDSRLLRDLGAEAYVGNPLADSAGRLSGVMAVMFRRPLAHIDFIASTLRIFAARATAELERRQVDERVREQAALLDKAQDAILVRDLQHTITYWNKSAERLYGWTVKEAVGRSVERLLYKDTTAFREAMAQLTARGEWVGELQQFNKQGEALTIEGRWTLVRDDQGTPRAVLAINTDITEKKKLELQFLRAQRMESIGTLAGGIAHDLNNVLSPIIMAIDLLKLSATDPRDQSMLSTMAASAKRGADMVGQVLSFARGVEGRRMEVRALHLFHELEKIVHDTFPKNIQIEMQCGEDLWPVTGDPTQLHQVLLNLCVNARDAMPDGGRLILGAQNQHIDAHYAAGNIEAKPGPYVVVQVEDTGSGIPREILDKIFDPFFTTKAVGKGTGLGLSTSLAIVKSHEGFIRVYSEPGRGTRFELYLPARAEGSAAVPAVAQIDLPHGHGELILVVDDEASIRQVTQQTLEAFGYKAVVAADGAEAVALYAARRGEIAAVITDMMMPVMDGPATIHALLKINPEVRIIAASGIAANGKAAKSAGTGARHFIPKPYTADLLLRALRKTLAGEE